MTEDDKALVERLRSRVSSREILLVDPPRPAPDRDCHYAADRIEALSAQLHTVLDREAETHRRHDAKVEALSAENERLREALRDVTPSAYFGESAENKARWAKARAALGNTK